jgi:[acyl-carrier-protein] S-malonyltransferase
MKCFMFPGQPLSRATSLPDDADFAELRDLVRSIARLDLDAFSWSGGSGSENVKLQLLGVVQSLYMLRKLGRLGIAPEIVAQHSMGIYAALVACSSLDEAEAIEITYRVGMAMARMGEVERYALGCVIGLTSAPVLRVAANNGVYLANCNTSRHFLLCGKRADMERATAEAMEAGAFSVRTFDCDAPLHTPLMAGVEEELLAIFNSYRYRDPICPLLNHLDQRYLCGSEVADFMRCELSLPVYWEKSYRALRAVGVTEFREIGAGESLQKYNRWIEAELASP